MRDRINIDRVRTIRAGNFVNLAHATGGAFVLSRRRPIVFMMEVIVAACGTQSSRGTRTDAVYIMHGRGKLRLGAKTRRARGRIPTKDLLEARLGQARSCGADEGQCARPGGLA